jgi:hypothetical protein
MATNGVVYFTTQIAMHVMFREEAEGKLEQQLFLQGWGSITPENSLGKPVMGLSGPQLDIETVKAKLEKHRVFHIATRYCTVYWGGAELGWGGVGWGGVGWAGLAAI